MHSSPWLPSAVAILLALALPAAPAQPGSLDTGFGTAGLAVALGPNAGIHAVEIQSNGKIVAAGRQGAQWAITRFNTNGSLDTSFGTQGAVLLFGTAGNDRALDMAIDDQDGILVVGRRITGGAAPFATVRLTSDGELDSTWGINGLVETLIGKGGESTGVVIQPDGKVVVGGRAYAKRSYAFALARYHPDGSLDTASFGDRKKKNKRKGYTLHDISRSQNDFPNEGTIALQSDGKILLGGYTGYSAQDNWTLARYNADGSVDTGFASGGVLIESFPGLDFLTLRGLAEHNGDIYTSGRCYDTLDPAFSFDTILVKHLADGSLDDNFGSGGVARSFSLVEDQGMALLVQPQDGRILVSSTYWVAPQAVSMVAWRFETDGTLDTTFGPGGDGLSELTGPPTGGPFGMCFGATSGEFFIGGGSSATSQFAVAKYFR